MKLLLLHPLPLDGSIFSNSLRDLVDDCVAPTLYTEGDALTAWARAALDAVGDGPVVVAGNSIGGSCAIEIAALAPSKVKGLVLCGTKAGHRPEGEHDRPERTRRLAGRLARGSFHQIDGVGHYVPLEAPNALAEIVADVLASAA